MTQVRSKKEWEQADLSGLWILLAFVVVVGFILLIGSVGLQGNIQDCLDNGGSWVSGRCHIPGSD